LSDDPDYITVNHACRIVGGNEKPISAATYYRGVKAGRLPAQEHPTPGVSRIRRGELIAKLNASDQGARDGCAGVCEARLRHAAAAGTQAQKDFYTYACRGQFRALEARTGLKCSKKH
jgi:hypothetical protein